MQTIAAAAAGLLIAGSSTLAFAQAPISGTPSSPYPLAAPHEIRDGCRTVLIPGTGSRLPVDCSGQMTTGSVGIAPGETMMLGPATTGSIDPYAAPHEVRDGCRTVLERGTNRRVPVDC